jgi:hypothetical protein
MLWDETTDTNKLPVIIDLARKATALRPYVLKNWETLARLDANRQGRGSDWRPGRSIIQVAN